VGIRTCKSLKIFFFTIPILSYIFYMHEKVKKNCVSLSGSIYYYLQLYRPPVFKIFSCVQHIRNSQFKYFDRVKLWQKPLDNSIQCTENCRLSLLLPSLTLSRTPWFKNHKTWYCHLYEWLSMEFWIIGFIHHLQTITTRNYNNFIELHSKLRDSELLYNWWFTANQFTLLSSPLRLATSIFFFQLNTCGYSPYVTFTLMSGWVCHLQF
jgi:hypothetical protein